MFLKNLNGLLLLAVLHAGAQASVITSTVHGVITGQAVDTAGLFGQAGASLSGLHFSSTVRYDRPAHSDHWEPHADRYESTPTERGMVSFDIVVNNVTLARQFAPVMMWHSIRDRQAGWTDEMQLSLRSDYSTGVVLNYQITNFANSFVPSLPSLESTLSYDTTLRDDLARGYFSLRGPPDPRVPESTSFEARITRVELNVASQSVPEPSTLLLFGIALAIGAAQWKRARLGA
jgi:hypothetical protein